MKFLNFFLILMVSYQLNSQNINTDSVFVMMDNGQFENLYTIEKNINNDLVKIKILHFDKRKEGFKSKKPIKSENEIVQVSSEPNNINYYEFTTDTPSFKIKSIEGLEIYNIENISENDKRVWRKFPYVIFFIKKLGCESYKVWKMTPTFNE